MLTFLPLFRVKNRRKFQILERKRSTDLIPLWRNFHMVDVVFWWSWPWGRIASDLLPPSPPPKSSPNAQILTNFLNFWDRLDAFLLTTFPPTRPLPHCPKSLLSKYSNTPTLSPPTLSHGSFKLFLNFSIEESCC